MSSKMAKSKIRKRRGGNTKWSNIVAKRGTELRDIRMEINKKKKKYFMKKSQIALGSSCFNLVN